MTTFRILTLLAMTGFCMACNGTEPAESKITTAEKSDHSKADHSKSDHGKSDHIETGYDGTIAKPGAPFSISYRIIGTPAVGSPTIVDLQIKSALEPSPVTLNYKIKNQSAMKMAAAQHHSVYMAPPTNEKAGLQQQVTLIPLRNGRFYLYVSASFETDTGSQSMVAAIPIQVGTGTRELTEHGVVETDENGDAIRVLSVE